MSPLLLSHSLPAGAANSSPQKVSVRSNRSTMGWALTSAKRNAKQAQGDTVQEDHVAGLPKKVHTVKLVIRPGSSEMQVKVSYQIRVKM